MKIEINMKTINFIKYAIALFLSAYIMISCTDNDDILSPSTIPADNGQPATVEINFATPATTSISISRAVGELPPPDYIVSELYIYIFDAETGNLLTLNDDDQTPAPTHLKGDGLLDGTLGGQEMKENGLGEYNSSWARAKIQSEAIDKDVYIYLVANVASYRGTGSSEGEEITLTHEKLMSLTQREELQALTYQYNTHIKAGRTSFLMTGHGGSGGHPDPVLYRIKKDGRIVSVSQSDGSDYEEGKIILERAESKIKFNIRQGTKKKGDFRLTSFQIKNYPKQSKLFWIYEIQSGIFNYNGLINKDAAAGEEGENYYFDCKPEEIPSGNTSFTFYMPETLVTNGKDISEKTTATAAKGFRQRELRDLEGNWINAPKYATYVEIKGTFTGKSDQLGESVTAEVTYMVHLGFTRPNKDKDAYMVNDYFILRNYEYTYNLTVNGIDDIAVEVIKNNQKEVNSGAEGHIAQSEEIILPKDNKLTVNANETLALQEPIEASSASWLKIGDKTINDWIGTTPAEGEYNLTAEALPQDMTERRVVITATRSHFQSSIKRTITIIQKSDMTQ